jgi:DNA-binding FadR family transcriptional regulator
MNKKKDTGGSGGPLSRVVTERIKNLIQEKKLTPGDKLPNEMELAERFNVSRPTIREAVKALVSQNVIEIRRGKGTFVSQNPGVMDDPLGLDFMQESELLHALAETRLLIEPALSRLAAEKADREDFEDIALHIRKMEEEVQRHQVEMDSDLEFHRCIVRAAGNPIMMRIVPVLLDAIKTTYEDAPRTSADHKQALKEHRIIFEALKKRSPEEASRAMLRHLENSYSRTLRWLKTEGNIKQKKFLKIP